MREARIHGAQRVGRTLCIVSTFMLALPCLAAAQQPAVAPPPAAQGREIPRPDQLEPGVTTIPAEPSASAAATEPAATGAPVAASAPAAPAASAPATPATQAPSAAASGASAPGAKASAAKAGGAGQNPATAKSASRKGPDRLELDATDITGNRELPKVLYIVPWKRSDLGDVVGRPVNSLLDEVLQPLDRDVFQRENRYYNALPAAPGDAKAGAAQGSPAKP
jgi:hypothetical protein